MSGLWESVVVTIIGMGAVFAFLTILVFFISLSGLLCRRWPAKVEEATPEEVAAISAAVQAYWQVYRGN